MCQSFLRCIEFDSASERADTSCEGRAAVGWGGGLLLRSRRACRHLTHTSIRPPASPSLKGRGPRLSSALCRCCYHLAGKLKSRSLMYCVHGCACVSVFEKLLWGGIVLSMMITKLNTNIYKNRLIYLYDYVPHFSNNSTAVFK